jgi:ABC-type xylose transport system substrate-binding protein
VVDDKPKELTLDNYRLAAMAQRDYSNVRAYTGTDADIPTIKAMIEQTPQFTAQA